MRTIIAIFFLLIIGCEDNITNNLEDFSDTQALIRDNMPYDVIKLEIGGNDGYTDMYYSNIPVFEARETYLYIEYDDGNNKFTTTVYYRNIKKLVITNKEGAYKRLEIDA